MKKLFFSIFALCVGLYAVTQSSVYFYQKDGKTLEFPVSSLDSISFTKPTTGIENGYKWVDLGLSVRWATMNVGATAPEEYGNYYAWGEIATKTTYAWSNYTLADGSSSTLTKYCSDASYGKDGFTDELTTLKAADDAATQIWGGNWRMPTIDEWSELKNNCDWIWTDNYNNTNVAGNIVTSKTNGNSIFIPAAGYCEYNELCRAGLDGGFWSSSLDTFDPCSAQYVYFGSSYHNTGYSYRCYGRSVRPVSKAGEVIAPCYSISLAEIKNGTVSVSATLAQVGETVTLKITPNTGYSLKTLSVKCGEKEVEVTDNSFIMPEGEVKITASFVLVSGTENGYTWIDLGLSVRWASMNVGATAPEEYGNYYAWGEIAAKSTYAWSNYTLADGSSSTLTKYCSDASYGKDGFTDELTTLKAADDAATQIWGGNWRMPTIDEWSELKNNCDWIWTDNYNNTNVAGDIVTSKTNGNSIFLPAAGFRYYVELDAAGSYGNYWSSSLNSDSPDNAQYVYFNADSHNTGNDYRVHGLSVRPVSKAGEVIPPCYSVSLAEIENGTVNTSATLAQVGETVTLKITPSSGYKLKSLSVMCGEKEVEVTDNSFIMPEGEVKITASFAVTTGTENGYTWVDLGLSVRWASMNVGATKPEDYGNYYAWGEIAAKSTYDWSTYKYADGSSSTLTKYCSDASYGKDGFTDELTTLKAADDAASQIWGGNWRMPTKDEWQELKDNCTWTWTTLNGVNGYEVKATNGNTIFLPAVGYYDGGELSNAGSLGYYWSSSLDTDDPGSAQLVYFYSVNHGTGYGSRYYGRSVRPVSKAGEVIAPCYNVSLAETENGTVSVNSTLAQAGETVTLKITPSSGYKLKSLSVKCGENEVEVTNNSFVMPEGEVKITASFVVLSFSVSAEKKVKFAPGNLQYTQSTNTWAFAANQYEMLCSADIISTALADKIDLFGWSANNTTAQWGISTSADNANYSGDFVDWGKNIGDGNTWRTLTIDEWVYLFQSRTDASSKYGVARINLNADGSQYTNGIIVLPDSWTCPSGITFKSGIASNYGAQYYADYQTFTLSQWQQLEQAGAVFLPAAGSRNSTMMLYIQVYGYYWSSSVYDADVANYTYGFYFCSSHLNLQDYCNRNLGHAVRLAQDVK
jgi:uncharacterized protein (TIGR02145 family)